MSVLERIRSKSGLAIGVVGFALLLFVVSDALNSNFGLFGGGGQGSDVGEIDGEKIDIRLFESKVKENENNYRMRSQQEAIDQNTLEMIREQTWGQIIQESLLDKEYKDLGLNVTDEELFELVQGEDPHPQIKAAPGFQNAQTGQYDRTLVVRYLKSIMDSDNPQAMQAKAEWTQFEDGIAKETAAKKFNSLLKKGIYATTLEAKAKYAERSRSTDVEMIALNYFSVPDTAITAEESDLKSYFNKNKDKYKEKENGRKIDFVAFDVIPTGEDSAAIMKWVSDQVAQFAAATNDTLYVDANNTESRFDTVPHPADYYPEEVANQLFSSPKGAIVGPVFKDGKYRIYKVSGVKEDSLYTMRASHILFKTEGPTNEDTLNTMKKAREVMDQIRKGADFGMMAAQYGTDATASRGGDLGWFREGKMIAVFSDAVKKGKTGDMMVLKTQFGVHIIKITGDKTKKLVTAGVMERTVEPSEQTENLAYSQAGQFAASLGDDADFDKSVAEKGLTKRVADNMKEGDKSIGGLPDAREVVRWAYNAKEGDVSDVFTVGGKYVVAKLVSIKDKGKAEFENVKDRVTADYRKDKKAEQLMEKATEAIAGSAAIADVATKLQLNVVPVMGHTFDNPSLPFVGTDYAFNGAMAGTSKGKISGPFKGDNAVYVYIVNNINEAPAQTDYSTYRNEIQSQASQRLEYGAFDALKEMNNVKDNRYKFY